MKRWIEMPTNKKKKQILCKHCGKPIFYVLGEWWHGDLAHAYTKCMCFAEPQKKKRPTKGELK
jgi:competence CoiA-like predicted nuclease